VRLSSPGEDCGGSHDGRIVVHEVRFGKWL